MQPPFSGTIGPRVFRTGDYWVEVLQAAGVPCGPVYDYAQMFADPQVRHRELVQ
jgi:crotonobetainyl-CoA:carnitine CoA-transferase CaiB-like acyl-CoA transferase